MRSFAALTNVNANLKDFGGAAPTPGAAFAATGEPCLCLFHIDDSPDDQILFQAACQRAQVPFIWQVANSADHAIAYLESLLEQSRTSPVSWPDAILLDSVMPLKSGADVLTFVRNAPELRHLPVIIFTGHPGEREEKWKEHGANALHFKPLAFEELVQFTRRLYSLVLKLKRAGGGTARLGLK